MERIKWPFIMSFVGIIIGLFIYMLISNTSYMNKTERRVHRSMTDSLILPICLVCGAIGFFVGLNANTEESNEKKHGINTAETYEKKDGRGWMFLTKWNNPNTNNENILITKKPPNDSLKSYFNGQLLFDHGINSAAKKMVYDCHLDARNKVWKKVQSEELHQL